MDLQGTGTSQDVLRLCRGIWDFGVLHVLGIRSTIKGYLETLLKYAGQWQTVLDIYQ